MSFNDLAVWLLLILGSACDIVRKKIPVLLLAGGVAAAAAAGAMAAWKDGTGNIIWGYGLMPGAGMILLAFATREKIGYGDGAFLILLGLLEGGRVMMDLLLALFLAAVFGIFLLILKRATVRTQIPFVPFLLAAHFLQSVIAG